MKFESENPCPFPWKDLCEIGFALELQKVWAENSKLLFWSCDSAACCPPKHDQVKAKSHRNIKIFPLKKQESNMLRLIWIKQVVLLIYYRMQFHVPFREGLINVSQTRRQNAGSSYRLNNRICWIEWKVAVSIQRKITDQDLNTVYL